MASRTAVPTFGRGFAGTQARPFTPFATTPGANGSVGSVLFGAACGALAVCSVQLVMVILSEMDLKRSVESVDALD